MSAEIPASQKTIQSVSPTAADTLEQSTKTIMNATVLIHFSGRDAHGMTAALTAILAEYDVCFLDIGQAVVHETLALGLLIEVPDGNSFFLLKEALLAKCSDLGLQVRFTFISRADLDH